MFWKQQKKIHVNPRFRAYGRARLEIAGRAQSKETWDLLWKPPQNPFPFSWGEGWKHCVEYKVDDFAAEVGFYVDVLGFPVNALDPEHAMFTSPNDEFYIAIIPEPVMGQSTPPDAIRLQFMIADILATTRTLENRGVIFEQQPGPLEEGSSVFTSTFRTPHGICVDLWGIVPEEEQWKANYQKTSPLETGFSPLDYIHPTEYETFQVGEQGMADAVVGGETAFDQPADDGELDLNLRPASRYAYQEQEEDSEADDEEEGFAEEEDDRFSRTDNLAGRYTFDETDEPLVFEDEEADFAEEEEDGQLSQNFNSAGRYTFDEGSSQGYDKAGEAESELDVSAGSDVEKEKVNPASKAQERAQLRFFPEEVEGLAEPDIGEDEAEVDYYIEPEYIPAEDDTSVETNITDTLKKIKSRNLRSNPQNYQGQRK